MSFDCSGSLSISALSCWIVREAIEAKRCSEFLEFSLSCEVKERERRFKTSREIMTEVMSWLKEAPIALRSDGPIYMKVHSKKKTISSWWQKRLTKNMRVLRRLARNIATKYASPSRIKRWIVLLSHILNISGKPCILSEHMVTHGILPEPLRYDRVRHSVSIKMQLSVTRGVIHTAAVSNIRAHSQNHRTYNIRNRTWLPLKIHPWHKGD